MESTKVSLVLAVLAFVAPPSGGPADSANVLLTEVLFAPAPGDTGFVELANVGGTAVDLSSMVLRIDTLVLPLPRLAEPLAPGARVLLRFDGRGTIEGNIVHAAAAFGLSAEGGVVSLLRNDDLVLDRVAWGTAEGAVQRRSGGRASSSVEPGSSFGRPPGANRPGAVAEWVLYPPRQVTPGGVNPMPPVVQLLPLDGAILEASPVDLGWYSVPGAVRYRVQLARDTVFGQPLLDQTVADPAISSGLLSPGVYWWRVQAIGAGDAQATWSPLNRLELDTRGGGGGGGGGRGRGGDGEYLSIAPTSVPKILNVPYLTQHKDSRMLLLESYQEGLPRTAGMQPRVPHKWDSDHGTLDKKDPADNTNCGLASMAMINHFYGGDLSQDRIGYEMFSRNVTNYSGRVNVRTIRGPAVTPLQEQAPGPDFDLNYGMGLSDERMLAEGLFALGTLPGRGSGYLSTDSIWSLAVAEINAGRPLMGYNCCHLFVVRGYEVRGTRRLLYVNDPWSGQYAYDLYAAQQPLGRMEGILSYPTQPAVKRQEVSVTTDSDGDGVFDFDEINRFRTNPNNKDSDGDGVPDKQDIESGIYETEFGLGYAWNPVPNSPGRDFDHDGIPTELDRDSDNGGCTDGEEDLNGDGIRTGAEKGNFNQTDDVCGNLQGNLSYLIDATNSDTLQMIKVIHDQGVILVRLKPESPGSEHYVDDGSTYSYQGYARIELHLGQNCILWGVEQAHGGGPFTVDAEIGGSRGDDGTLALGAHADVPGQSSAGGCGPSGTGPSQRTMSFPDCQGILAPPPPGPPGILTYQFDCTTKPQMGPGWTVNQFYARGFVRVQ